jgi:hypothetical protein
MCFYIRWDLPVTSCIPVRPGSETLTHYFSCSGGHGAVSIKNAPEHVMAHLCLHPVGSAGHVVHSGASEARNGDTLYFMLGWDRYGFSKKCTIATKNALGHITQNLCFWIRWDL